MIIQDFYLILIYTQKYLQAINNNSIYANKIEFEKLIFRELKKLFPKKMSNLILIITYSLFFLRIRF